MAHMTQSLPSGDTSAVLAEARARAGAFPVAPLAMPDQDMTPAKVSLRLSDFLPAVLRRLVSRTGVVRH